MNRRTRVTVVGAFALLGCDGVTPDPPDPGRVEPEPIVSPNDQPPPDSDALIGFDDTRTQADYDGLLADAAAARTEARANLATAFGDWVDSVVLAVPVSSEPNADGSRLLTTLAIQASAKGDPPEALVLTQWTTTPLHPPAQLEAGEPHVLLINPSDLDGGAWVLALAGVPNILYPNGSGFAAPGYVPADWTEIQSTVEAW